MPFEIIWEAKGVVRKFRGPITGDDLRDSLAIMHAQSRYYDTKYAILDCLEATDCTITPVDTGDQLASQIGAAITSPNRVVAVVATNPTIVDLAGRYATHPATPHPLKVFSTMEEARRWIAAHCPTCDVLLEQVGG